MSDSPYNKNHLPEMINYSDLLGPLVKPSDMISAELLDAVNEDIEREEKYKADVLQTLRNIEANTIGLNEIIPLLSGSIEKQDEILEFLKDSLAISASETTEEAEGKLRKILTKAGTLSTDIENIQKLTGFASTIYKMFVKTISGE